MTLVRDSGKLKGPKEAVDRLRGSVARAQLAKPWLSLKYMIEICLVLGAAYLDSRSDGEAPAPTGTRLRDGRRPRPPENAPELMRDDALDCMRTGCAVRPPRSPASSTSAPSARKKVKP